MLLLLPAVARKLKRSMPSLLPHPPVLAHTIYQAISFDGALREEGFDLSGTSAEITQGKSEWKGVSDTVLGRSDWFTAWLHGEKQCTRSLARKFPFLRFPDGHSPPCIWPYLCCCFFRSHGLLQSPWISTILPLLRATLGGWSMIKGMNRVRNKT